MEDRWRELGHRISGSAPLPSPQRWRMTKIETESFPINEDVRAAQKAGRLAYLLESAAVLLLAALAAYAAST
jgi:hypothetical protein